MAVKIQLRRDTADNWSANNPVLAEGEVAIEIDTNRIKIGDGSTAWNDLPYFLGEYDSNNDGKVDMAEQADNATTLQGHPPSDFADADHTHSVEDLSNVNISNPADSQVIAYDETNSEWVNKTIPNGDMKKLVYDSDDDGQVEKADHADTATDAQTLQGKEPSDFAEANHTHVLSELSDVNISNPGDGEVLTYDSDNNVWKNAVINISGGGSGGGDMYKATYDPDDDGQVEKADYADSAGDAQTLQGNEPSAFADADHTHLIDNLGNVNIDTPGDGQALIYDSSLNKWVNGSITNANNILIVETISDLLGIDTSQLEEKTYVQVAGYHVANDGGGGVFYWDSNESKANHNGGTIIDPDKAFPTDWSDTSQQQTWFNASNSGTGCWKRVILSKFSVKWFGARGDNNTDDTLAIKKASESSKKIFFPKGIYRVSAQLEIPKGAVWEGIGSEASPQYATDHWDVSDYGSVFAIIYGAGGDDVNDSAILLNSFSTLKGINIWYPNQSGSTDSPDAYPPAIALNPAGDSSEYNNRIIQPKIEKCILVNPYIGIDATAEHEMLTIKGVKFTAWKKGIVIHKSYDIDRLVDIQSNPTLSYKGDFPSNSILDYHKAYNDTIGIDIAKADQIYLDRIFVYGFYYSLYFSIKDNMGVNGCIVKQSGFEGCGCCVYAITTSDANDAIRRILFEGCMFGNSEDFNYDYALIFKKNSADTVPAEISFVDCVVWTAAKVALYLENILDVNVNACKFYDICKVDPGWTISGIYVKNCKNVLIANSNISLNLSNNNCLYYHIDGSNFVRIIDCFFRNFSKDGSSCAAIDNSSAHVRVIRPCYENSVSVDIYQSSDVSDVQIESPMY